MWPTPTPYPFGDGSDLPALSALDNAPADIGESLVAGYNVMAQVPAFSTIGYLFVMIVFFFLLWTVIMHWKKI